ncbi:MAG: DUF3006 domain-containing protein [Acidobacteriota bacterium]
MKVVIDRIEGEWAVLVDATNDAISFNVPLDYLPAGARAGDHLNISFQLDQQSRAATEQQVKQLLDDLTKSADPTKKKFKL